MKSSGNFHQTILLGSHNPHKKEEVAAILSGFQIITPSQVGIQNEPEENGKTFLENATAKSLYFSQKAPDYLVLADDSGIEVDALDGKPGVHSKRFSGPKGDSAENNQKLLSLLEGLDRERRKAQFRCAMVLSYQGKALFQGEGIVRGWIAFSLRGNQGFGYDPLFYYPPFQKTFGEVPPEEKNRVSHRYLALRTIQYFLETNKFHSFETKIKT
ncbi:MAG: RdgB/HAM1 family non-canonical purine NTP pyrophosphatase [Planctomycetota bacterium]|nr:MAG: RdgB/HAM1 family non-canonical purine NTP pyrophosphatase [Planctomycetota bacterium]